MQEPLWQRIVGDVAGISLAEKRPYFSLFVSFARVSGWASDAADHGAPEPKSPRSTRRRFFPANWRASRASRGSSPAAAWSRIGRAAAAGGPISPSAQAARCRTAESASRPVVSLSGPTAEAACRPNRPNSVADQYRTSRWPSLSNSANAAASAAFRDSKSLQSGYRPFANRFVRVAASADQRHRRGRVWMSRQLLRRSPAQGQLCASSNR